MPQRIFLINDVFELGDISDRQAPVARVLMGNRQGVGLVTTVGTQLRQFAPMNRLIAGGARQQFMWLPYSPKTTNYVGLGPYPVLSGPFSGCYMIVYRQAGVVNVCHVATPEAKASWNQFANLPVVEVLQGFRPHEHTHPPAPVTAGNNGDLPGAFKIFGLVANNEMYALFTYRQQVAGIPLNTRFRVAEVSGPIPTLPINTLKNLP